MTGEVPQNAACYNGPCIKDYLWYMCIIPCPPPLNMALELHSVDQAVLELRSSCLCLPCAIKGMRHHCLGCFSS